MTTTLAPHQSLAIASDSISVVFMIGAAALMVVSFCFYYTRRRARGESVIGAVVHAANDASGNRHRNNSPNIDRESSPSAATSESEPVQ
jgi:hypothetical protein